MKKSMIWLSSLLLFGTVTLFTSCDDDDDDTMESTTIVSFAQDSEDYTLLADAVVAADLDGLLSSPGSYTVFAPDNDAFEALLASNNDWNSIDDIPADVLTAVLTNHVLPASLTAENLQTAYYSTLSESGFGDAAIDIYISTDGGVTLNGGPVVELPDQEVSNGVIHGIDAVIELPTVVTFATTNPNLTSLVAALTRDDLSTDFVAALSGEGPFTVFAPTNAAFQSLLDSNDDWNTLNDIPVATLEAVLSYHVVSGTNARSEGLTDGMSVSTLGGESISLNVGDAITIEDNSADTDDAEVVLADIQSSNGVVHVIDQVLLP